LHDAAASLSAPEPVEAPQRLPVGDERYHVSVQKRALSLYARVAAGSGVTQ